MLKVTPNTKEQLIYFLLNNISLGTYDKKFLNNLQALNLLYKKPLTTNQATLLDKVVMRYGRQLSKLELNPVTLVQLPWDRTPIQSIPEFTEAHLKIEDTTFILRSPYKKEFLNEFGKVELQGVWDKEEKFWSIPASSFSLKILSTLVEKHYGKINYCDNITRMLDEVSKFSQYKYWNPTYVFNGSFIIKGITEPLNEATKHIDFEPTLKTLARVARYGIAIDDSVIDEYLSLYDSDYVEFAKEKTYTVELDDMSIVDKLLTVEPDLIVISSFGNHMKSYFSQIKEALNDKTEFLFLDSGGECMPPAYENKLVIKITSGMWIKDARPMTVAKTIHVVNSKPIELG